MCDNVNWWLGYLLWNCSDLTFSLRITGITRLPEDHITSSYINWANVDPDLCRHMASLGHKKLNIDWSTISRRGLQPLKKQFQGQFTKIFNILCPDSEMDIWFTTKNMEKCQDSGMIYEKQTQYFWNMFQEFMNGWRVCNRSSTLLDCYTVLAWWQWDCQWGKMCVSPIGSHHTFVIGWPKYRLGLPSAPLHYGLTWPMGIPTVFQTPATVPLHCPNGRQMPLGLYKGTKKESSALWVKLHQGLIWPEGVPTIGWEFPPYSETTYSQSLAQPYIVRTGNALFKLHVYTTKILLTPPRRNTHLTKTRWQKNFFLNTTFGNWRCECNGNIGYKQLLPILVNAMPITLNRVWLITKVWLSYEQ